MNPSKKVPIAPKAFGMRSATATLTTALDAVSLDAVEKLKDRLQAASQTIATAKADTRRERRRADDLAAAMKTEAARKDRDFAMLQAAYDELAQRVRPDGDRSAVVASEHVAADGVDQPDEVDRLRLDVDTAADLMLRCEAERDAALRARDAAQARLDGHLEAEGRAIGPVAGVRALLEADTAEGMLVLAERYCTLLRITCDRKAAAALDQGGGAPTYRRRLADTLATLQAYAEAKTAAFARGRATGPGLANLKSYCTVGSDALISQQTVILSEGQIVTTSRKMSGQRRLPVPDDVDPTGRAVMVAHVRIGSGKPPAPRLYFGDYLDQHGFLVVGYVGEHLTNLATN